MSSLIRILQAALLISTIAVCVLLFQLNQDFSLITAYHARIFGIPFAIGLTIVVFWMGSWTSRRALIYGALFLALTLELIPPAFFMTDAYPSRYYIDPDGTIVVAKFPGNVFEGKAKQLVNDKVIAALTWQQGKRTDASGKPLLFYRVKQDGTILVFQAPIDLGEVLNPIDSVIFEKYESQQMVRAEGFIKEGDLAKAKQILEKITGLDPNNDQAYRLTEHIRVEEEKRRAEVEQARLAAEQIQKDQALAQSSDSELEEPANRVVIAQPSESVSNAHVRQRSPRSQCCPSESVNYSYQEPTYQSAPVNRTTPVYRPAPTYQQPVAQQSAPTYRVPERPIVESPRATASQTSSRRVYVAQTSPSAVQVVLVPRSSTSEKKKGMSWKKKLLIGGAIVGGVIIGEEIIRRH